MLKAKLLSATVAAGEAPLSMEDVFATALYSGNGSAQTITNGIDLAGEGGLVWIKTRNASVSSFLFDTARGTTKELNSNTTDAEQTLSGSVTAFNSNGFTIGGAAGIGQSSRNYASWTFRKAPGFFDLVTYTGNGAAREISHDLGVTPELWIIKCTSAGSTNWIVGANGHLGDSAHGGYMFLDLTAAEGTFANLWTTPSSTAFGFGSAFPTSDIFNASGASYVAYLFASLSGGSKVGRYTGTGSSQTIDCGFTGGARFVLIKRANSTGDWYVWDTARGIVSGNDPYLRLNSTAAEVTTNDTIDPDSSGFIVNQVAATNVNVSSASYIYLAIA